MNRSESREQVIKEQAAEHRPARWFNVPTLFMVILILLLLLQVLRLVFSDRATNQFDRLPISIQASSQADYSRDPQGIPVPPISENIFDQIIMDIPATGDARDRMATLQVLLTSPVTTITHAFPPVTVTVTPNGIFSSPFPSATFTRPATASPRVTSTTTTPLSSTSTTIGNGIIPSLLPTILPLPTIPLPLPTIPLPLPTIPLPLPTLPLLP